ncbi:MAG: response regulator transcription factor [Rhodospirillales bacterium]|nr:response regulator transcription factor [Rhodospirillales bacterium]
MPLRHYGTAEIVSGPFLYSKEGDKSKVAVLRERDRSRFIVYVQSENFFRECVSKCLSYSYRDAKIAAFPTVRDCCKSGIEPLAVTFILYGIDHRHGGHDELGDELAQLSRVFPAAPVILLSDRDAADHVLDAVKRGARGVISTNETLDVAVGATQVVTAGGSFVPEHCLSGLRPARDGGEDRRRRHDDFTPRQMAVLKRLRQGKANRIIAHELEMSESRVKAHVRNLMQKLNATNRTQVAFLTKAYFNDRHPKQSTDGGAGR